MTKPKPRGPRLSIIPARAVIDPAISAQALRVLCLLGRHTDNEGWCCRSQVQMAKELACGRATIQRGIEELKTAGYVQTEANGRGQVAAEDSAFPFSSYSYRVLLDTVDEPEGVPARGQGGAQQRAGGAHSGGQGVPTPRAPLTERTSSNDHLLTTRGPPRAPERRGDPEPWQRLEANLSTQRLAKLEAWGAELIRTSTSLVLNFERAAAERPIMEISRYIIRAWGGPCDFEFKGRKVAV